MVGLCRRPAGPRIDWIFDSLLDELTDPSAPDQFGSSPIGPDGPFAPPVIGSRHRPTDIGLRSTLCQMNPGFVSKLEPQSWAANCQAGSPTVRGAGPASASPVRYAISL